MDSKMEIHEKVNRMIGPALKVQQSFEPLLKLQKLSEPALKIQQTLDPLLKLQQMFEPLLKFQKAHFLSIQESMRKVAERLKLYVEKTPEHFLLIAHHGWFIEIDSELWFPSQIANEIQTGSVEEANELLVVYYKDNLGRIFEDLHKRHPGRKEIFHQIFESFKNGYHNVVVPSVLSQVDGICVDFTRKKFFIKERKNYLPEVITELAGKSLDLFLSPLQNNTPIIAREQELEQFPCRLNRHEILHGISTDYGTEINSLKVISLLKYVSDILTEIDGNKIA